MPRSSRARTGRSLRAGWDGAGFFVLIVDSTVIEHPARVFGAARLVNEAADGFFLAVPEPADATGFLVFAPQPRIDVPVIVEGATRS